MKWVNETISRTTIMLTVTPFPVWELWQITQVKGKSIGRKWSHKWKTWKNYWFSKQTQTLEAFHKNMLKESKVKLRRRRPPTKAKLIKRLDKTDRGFGENFEKINKTMKTIACWIQQSFELLADFTIKVTTKYYSNNKILQYPRSFNYQGQQT